MKKKSLFLLGMVAVLSMSVVGCEDVGRQEETNYTQEVMVERNRTVPMPTISDFFEASAARALYEMRDDPGLVCYWYTYNMMTGRWVYQGPCVGYGIPYGVQLTSPDVVDYSTNGNSVVSQAEPNGLYTSGSTNATWILGIQPDGTISPEYTEQDIHVTQVKEDRRICDVDTLPDDYDTFTPEPDIESFLTSDGTVSLSGNEQ